MKSEWKNCCLGDLCDSISETYDRKDDYVVLVNTSDVLEGKILNHKKEKKLNLKGQFKKTFKKGDILFSEIRPINKRFAFVDFSDTEYYIASTKLMILRAKDNVILPKYLYYILKSKSMLEKLQYLAETRSGTFPQITFNCELSTIHVSLPNFSIQQKIVNILNSIDDKIELNNAINKNLEEQAIAIFSKLITGKDKNGCLGDYCTIKSGFAFKSDWWQNFGVKVIKIGSIKQDNIDLTCCSFVANDKIPYAKDYSVIGGDLLIAMTGATIGKFAIVPKVEETILVNQRVGKFLLGNKPIERLPFIYCQLKQSDVYNEIINRGQGSAQPNISAFNIMSIPCVIPSEEEILSFNNQTQEMFELIIYNQLENKRFTELRVILLTKLMSGEIDVSDIDL